MRPQPPRRPSKIAVPLLIGGGLLGLCVVSGLVGSIVVAATGSPSPSSTRSRPAAAASSPAALTSPDALAPVASASAGPSSPAAPSPKPSACDPNYAGACVPIATDVDCAGGSGNGPAYFSGVARVVGVDIYDLDRDHDGLACEKDPAPKPSSKPPTKKPSPKPQSKCDPNYADGCVPIASDVDCGGGSGNGPAYFYGVARVVGVDIYGLDRDHDGLACEKD